MGKGGDADRRRRPPCAPSRARARRQRCARSSRCRWQSSADRARRPTSPGRSAPRRRSTFLPTRRNRIRPLSTASVEDPTAKKASVSQRLDRLDGSLDLRRDELRERLVERMLQAIADLLGDGVELIGGGDVLVDELRLLGLLDLRGAGEVFGDQDLQLRKAADVEVLDEARDRRFGHLAFFSELPDGEGLHGGRMLQTHISRFGGAPGSGTAFGGGSKQGHWDGCRDLSFDSSREGQA